MSCDWKVPLPALDLNYYRDERSRRQNAHRDGSLAARGGVATDLFAAGRERLAKFCWRDGIGWVIGIMFTGNRTGPPIASKVMVGALRCTARRNSR